MQMTYRVLALATIGALAGCFLPGSHGLERDISAFISAALLPSNQVVFSFKYTVFRPAQGLAAFPDGGIAKFTVDENMIGVFNVSTGAMHLLTREKNTLWSHDQGHFFITQSNGPLVLVSRGGQTRDLRGSLNANFLLNVDDRRMREVRFKEALADKGQTAQATYLVSPSGDMVFVTAAVSAKPNAEEGQIWLRSPDDTYHLVADTHHYEGVENGEVVFWLLPTREFKAYNMTTHETRSLPGYKVRGYVDVTEGVTVPSTGEKIEYGHKVDGKWIYTPLPLAAEALKKAKVSR